MQFLSVFLKNNKNITNITEIADFWWKNTDVSRKGVCHMIYTFFGSFLEKVLKSAKFHPCGICIIGFREGFLFDTHTHTHTHTHLICKQSCKGSS